MDRVLYIGPVVLDEPEEFSLPEFARQVVALEAERLYYSNGRIYFVEYETVHGIIDEKLVVVELISYTSFTTVDEYRSWIVYYGNDDNAEYVDKIRDLRGDMTIIPVLRTRDRFIRKIEEMIERGQFRSFVE
ncbi:hypothetical protein [Archaeoglobus neptunius]|uniref:hypothetical protein n=1 Tax=Archaeoglobus neptunius TaxID=2798580 RepID=UPI0019257B71|nr:hypothetical protein [Archaeoglobus neptunius]